MAYPTLAPERNLCLAGPGVRLVIGETAPHEVYLDHLVVQDGAVLGGVDGVVDPDLTPGDEPVAEPMAAQGEIDIEEIPDRPAGDEPDLARTRRDLCPGPRSRRS